MSYPDDFSPAAFRIATRQPNADAHDLARATAHVRTAFAAIGAPVKSAEYDVLCCEMESE